MLAGAALTSLFLILTSFHHYTLPDQTIPKQIILVGLQRCPSSLENHTVSGPNVVIKSGICILIPTVDISIAISGRDSGVNLKHVFQSVQILAF